MPTADPVLLTRAAHALLPPIHEGIKYARAGIMVTDLRPTGNQAPWPCSKTRTRNATSAPSWKTSPAGTAAAPSAWATPASGAAPDWTMKRDMLSPRYTTHWDELPLVRAA